MSSALAGWNLGRAALWVSFAAVSVHRAALECLAPQCVDNDALIDIPASLDESAFDNVEYHQLAPPFNDFRCLPKHIHLSQATDVNEENKVRMTVSFTLDYHNCQGASPYILFGRVWRSRRKRAGTPLQYNFTSTARNTDFYHSNWIYHVTLPNLKAGEYNYWYRIVVDQGGGLRGAQEATPILSFRTPPQPGMPTSLALIGDLGQTLNSSRTMSHIYRGTIPSLNANPISMLLIMGDMSYADTDPHLWPTWFEMMEPLLRTTPIEVAPGNHEIECDNVTSIPFQPYENLFSNANRIGPADILPVTDEYRKTLSKESCATPAKFLGHYNYGNAFYTFQHGLARIIVLNSYTDSSSDSVQFQWLEEVLKNVDRVKTPWLIVGFHCPLYTTFLGHNSEPQTLLMKKYMEPLFVMYGVNIVFSGHDHAYSRSHPVAFDKVVENGPIYLTLGAGGNREGHARGYINRATPEDWVAARDIHEYGFGHLLLQNRTHANFNWMRWGTASTMSKGVQDSVWIINPHA